MEIANHNYGINREELKNFVLNNPRLVTRKESKRHPRSLCPEVHSSCLL